MSAPSVPSHLSDGSANVIASLDAIRAQFPALDRREGDQLVAYFDGPGGTQVPRSVADAMTHYLLHRTRSHPRSPPESRRAFRAPA